MNRRKFFKSLIQGGIFSALTVTSGYLLFREKKLDNKVCYFDFVCQNCKKTSHCQLPEASKFRMHNRVK